MSPHSLDRRQWLVAAAATAPTAVPAAIPAAMGAAPPAAPPHRFRYCLNTSTVRNAQGQSRPLPELIAIAQKAGYDAIEPWTQEIEAYLQSGGNLRELRRRIADAGLQVADLIGFAEWIVADEQRRQKGLEQARRYMDWAAQLGCPYLAAPPVGATGGTSPRDHPQYTTLVGDLMAAADRYRVLVDIGQQFGVVPLFEFWGFSRTLRRLGEAVCVAAEAGTPRGGILPDVYHLYKGGSDFHGLRLLAAAAIGIFHVNDYPAIPREKITDADRVFPGDGTAPLATVVSALRAMNYNGFLSLELFNRTYWKRDPHEVARTGLAKMRAVAEGNA